MQSELLLFFFEGGGIFSTDCDLIVMHDMVNVIEHCSFNYMFCTVKIYSWKKRIMEIKGIMIMISQVL